MPPQFFSMWWERTPCLALYQIKGTWEIMGSNLAHEERLPRISSGRSPRVIEWRWKVFSYPWLSCLWEVQAGSMITYGSVIGMVFGIFSA